MVGKTAGGNAAFHNFHNDYVHIEDPNEREYPTILQRSDNTSSGSTNANAIFQDVALPSLKSTRPLSVGTM